MNITSPGTHSVWAGWLIGAAAVGLAVVAVGGGAFYWSCQRQSERYDLSQLSRAPGFVPLQQIPREALNELVAQDFDPVEKLAAVRFGVKAGGLRNRLVRKMVASEIARKYSPREIAAFYLNDVTPGVAALHQMAAREALPATPVASEVTYAANTLTQPTVAAPAVPAEISPLPPEAAPLPVRRAVAVEAPRAMPVNNVPVARALPVAASRTVAEMLADDVPVRRARLVELGAAATSAQVRLSPQTIYRIAVADR